MLTSTNATIAIIGLALAACGSNSRPNNNPDAHQGGDGHSADAKQFLDAPPHPADARVCSSSAAAVIDFDMYEADVPDIAFKGTMTGSLGDGNTLQLELEFYDGVEPSLTGTFDLSAGNQNNYSTCAVCVRAFDSDSGGNVVKSLFQVSGSVTLSQDPVTTEHVIASFSNVVLQEVTFDPNTFVSTPVAGGACSDVADFSVDHDAVPNAWTCAHAKYNDGTTCDCMCGIDDPDCVIESAPVGGCTTNQTCFNTMCESPPANDTCQTATPLVINTPIMGTTIGAHNNYDAGLDGATCTDAQQEGGDVAYSVTLTASQPITVTLSNLDADYDGSVSLVGPGAATICDANPIATCVAGADSGFEGDSETFMYTATTAGTYYVIVDSFYSTEAGAFTLTVTSP